MKNNKGFTLIEILAVIVILGIIMIIAIPNISKNISDSRKSSYVTSIQKYIEAARQEVQTFSIKANKENTAYYIPTHCLGTENGDVSPFGDMLESYVVVTYETGGHYEYYYVGHDETNHGMPLTHSDDIDVNNLRDDVTDVDVTQKVGGRDLVVVYSDSCDNTTTRYGTETSIVCGRTVGESTGWTYADRTITVECVGNCSQSSFSQTFSTTTKTDDIEIRDGNGHTNYCSVDVYVDKSEPGVTINAESNSYRFVKDGDALSGIKIRYCVDANNICIPDIEVSNNEKVDDMKNLIGKYYIRYAIYTGAGYSSPVQSYAVQRNPYVEVTTNNDNKTINFQIKEGNSSDRIVYNICENSICQGSHEVTSGTTVTASGTQCVKYYVKSGSNRSLETQYCFY